MYPPQIGQRQVVYQDMVQQIYTVMADFGSFTKKYFVRDSGKRAGLVVVQSGSVLLVQQYRLLINGLSWEIPGGKVDEGELPESAAVRECLEETGIRCLNPRLLVFYHAGLDVTYNPTYIFYSDQVAENHEPASIHIQEVSGWKWVPLDCCIEMIFQGQIADSFSIISLLAYQALMDKPGS